jgi:hypothetical protein
VRIFQTLAKYALDYSNYLDGKLLREYRFVRDWLLILTLPCNCEVKKSANGTLGITERLYYITAQRWYWISELHWHTYYVCRLTTKTLYDKCVFRRFCRWAIVIQRQFRIIEVHPVVYRWRLYNTYNICFIQVQLDVQSNTTRGCRFLYYLINNNDILVIQRTRHVSTLFGGHHQVLQRDKLYKHKVVRPNGIPWGKTILMLSTPTTLNQKCIKCRDVKSK